MGEHHNATHIENGRRVVSPRHPSYGDACFKGEWVKDRSHLFWRRACHLVQTMSQLPSVPEPSTERADNTYALLDARHQTQGGSFAAGA